MYRDIFMNKWVLGGVGFLIVLSVACYFWYQHDIADERKAAAEAEELLRQSERSQETDTPTITKKAADVSVESTTHSTESAIAEPTDAQIEATIIINGRTIVVPDVPAESPHGFGPFPEVPEDYIKAKAGGAVWLATNYNQMSSLDQRQRELLDRVLLKLWSEGARNFRGGGLDSNGKVYPNYFDTVYISVKEHISPDGIIIPILTRQLGKVPKGVDIFNPPDHITVLNFETAGIDPYEYLNLR